MRVVLGILAVVLAVVLFLALKDDGKDGSSDRTTTTRAVETAPDGTPQKTAKPAEPVIATVVLDKSGKPAGGVAEISVDEGEEIRFEVKSDVADEIHVHGYDIGREVDAGGSVKFGFPATIEG